MFCRCKLFKQFRPCIVDGTIRIHFDCLLDWLIDWFWDVWFQLCGRLVTSDYCWVCWCSAAERLTSSLLITHPQLFIITGAAVLCSFAWICCALRSCVSLSTDECHVALDCFKPLVMLLCVILVKITLNPLTPALLPYGYSYKASCARPG